MGHFNGQSVHMLPTSIKELRLALADDHDALDWCEALPKLSHVLPSLRNIWIHVTGSVSPDLLPILPQLLYRPRLYLSNVGDDNISWASRVARALLHPCSKYASVGLVRSSLSSRGVSQLAELLHHQDVGVYAGRGGGLMVASTHLSHADVQSVSGSVFRYLNCSLTLMNDDEIWDDESIYEELYEWHMYENTSGGVGVDRDNCRPKTESEDLYEYISTNQAEAVNTNSHKKASVPYLEDSEEENNSEHLSSIYEDMKKVTGGSASSFPTPRSDFSSQPMPPRAPQLLPTVESSCSNADKTLDEYVNLSDYASVTKVPPLPPRKSSRAAPVSSIASPDQQLKSHTNRPPKPLTSRWSLNSFEHKRSPPHTEVSSICPDSSRRQVEPSSPKYFFPSHQEFRRPSRPSRVSLPAIIPPPSSHLPVDHRSSTRVISPPIGFTDHPHPKTFTGKPILPCPLTPKLTPLPPNGDYCEEDN